MYLDDWQQWCLDQMLAEDATGRWATSLILLILPRQNGKNAILEALELYAFYVLHEPRILHTAHKAKTAADHMRRMTQLVRANPELAAITQIVKSNGKEALVRIDPVTKNETRLEFVTRAKGTARGGSPTRIIFDEALYLEDAHLDAILPALSAQSMNDDPPQMIYTSSAPKPESLVLHRVRDAALTAPDSALFFAEWSVPDGIDIRDDLALTEALHLANPGMGIRISEDWVRRNELVQLSTLGFLNERLGVVPESDGSSKVLANWSRCFDVVPCPKVPVRIALSVAPGGVSAAFTVCGPRTDKLAQLEFTRHEAGTWWVVDEAVRATKALGVPLTVDPRSPTSGVLADLVAAKVPLQEVSTAEYVQACAALQIAVANLVVRHIGQPSLDAAVAGADIRPVGDGGWAWSRKSSAVDITPLESMTLALWSHMGAVSKPKARFISLDAVLAGQEDR